MAAIEGQPKLARPDASKSRLFNLRIYESHNERAGKKKIEMFNRGELNRILNLYGRMVAAACKACGLSDGDRELVVALRTVLPLDRKEKGPEEW